MLVDFYEMQLELFNVVLYIYLCISFLVLKELYLCEGMGFSAVIHQPLDQCLAGSR